MKTIGRGKLLQALAEYLIANPEVAELQCSVSQTAGAKIESLNLFVKNADDEQVDIQWFEFRDATKTIKDDAEAWAAIGNL